MQDKFTVVYRDRQYGVERGRRPGTASQGGGAPVGADRWYITLGPKAITSLEGTPDDTEASVGDRVRAWLDAHPEMPSRPDIILGGG
jgi:hypothetical protein